MEQDLSTWLPMCVASCDHNEQGMLRGVNGFYKATLFSHNDMAVLELVMSHSTEDAESSVHHRVGCTVDLRLRRLAHVFDTLNNLTCRNIYTYFPLPTRHF